MNDDRVKHLELIQGTISRMANNSFLLKGWTITLVAALFALSAKDTNIVYSILALFPALSFWGLDAYYLRQERLYRRLFEEVCTSTKEKPCEVALFSLNISKYQRQVASWLATLWTPTILLIHGVTVALVLVIVGISIFVV
jgi:hypothetical protein